MKVLVSLCLSFILFGVISADEEYNKKREKIVSFYKCIACAPADVQASYEKCSELKPEKIKERGMKCYDQVLGSNDARSSEDCWKELCQNPANVDKIFECMSEDKDEFKKSLTEEDITAFKNFKNCAKGLKDQYCTEK